MAKRIAPAKAIAPAPAAGAVAVPSPARREIASIQRDIFHWFYQASAAVAIAIPRDDTLMQRGMARGYWIYDDLERDARVFSVMQKRKSALNAYPWQLDAASEAAADKAAAELVERAFKGMNFNNTVSGLMDAVLKGFAVGEVMWDVVDGEILPVEVKMRDQRRFKFTTDYRLRLLTFENMLEGEELPPRKFVTFAMGAKDGNPYGLGIGTVLFWSGFFKKLIMTFQLTFLDKFGSPTAWGKYPPNADQSEQDKLLEVLQRIANDTAIITPENMMVELLEATRTGTTDAYEKALRYFDEQIAEAALGETLSTNIGAVGSKAASETHNAVRLELSKSDGELLDAALNSTLVKWIVELNMPDAKPPKLRHLVDQEEDLDARAERDGTISGMGFEPSEDYVNETYGGRGSTAKVWTKKAAPAAPDPGALPARPPGRDTDPAFAERVTHAPTTADRFAERLAREGAAPIEAMVEEVRLLFAECGSLEECRDRLLELFPKLKSADFAEVMKKALTAVDLAGRYEAK